MCHRPSFEERSNLAPVRLVLGSALTVHGRSLRFGVALKTCIFDYSTRPSVTALVSFSD